MTSWQVMTAGWLRLATDRAGKTQPCRQMGENELEWERMSLNGCLPELAWGPSRVALAWH